MSALSSRVVDLSSSALRHCFVLLHSLFALSLRFFRFLLPSQGPLSTLLNKPYDAFADEGGEEEEVVQEVKKQKADHIHIRIQQRNGRKTITTLQGVPAEYDLKKLLKAFKKEFACNGSIEEHDEHGKVIQLQGDQRQNIYDILVDEGIEKETIKVHGF
ncbi:hypothetical protein JCM6882_008870 [Rhodosporidiobolus microsporus]